MLMEKTHVVTFFFVFVGCLIICVSVYLICVYSSQNSAKKHKYLNQFFSKTYNESRSKFIKESSNIKGAIIHSLPINNDDNLYIDLTYIPGTPNCKELLLHVSGAHGCEGFAGSAMQIRVLSNTLPNIYELNEHDIIPHILFIHGLNPYGMKYGRRFTNDNIDLNRNCIFDNKTWEAIKINNNSNKYDEYKKWDWLINPKRKPTIFKDDIWIWFEMIKGVIQYGIKAAKKIVSGGQYFKENGIFFGGFELSKEHRMVSEYIQSNECINKFGINLINDIESLTIIDIHTGFGGSNTDTLLLQDSKDESITNKLFPHFATVIPKDISRDDTYGMIASKEGYSMLFKNVKQHNLYSIIHEFGTINNIRMFLRLRNENMAFQYCNSNNKNDDIILKRHGKRVQNAYYMENNVKWKENVLKKGCELFKGCLLKNSINKNDTV